jgi:hypothetical protein
VSGSNPLIGRILDAGERFRAGSISAQQLQAEISGNMSALEGNVPRSIRDAALDLEANIDSPRFTVDESLLHATITQLVDNFAALVARPPDIANPSWRPVRSRYARRFTFWAYKQRRHR